MNIQISQTKPTNRPIREYETQILYVGLKYRYDTHTKRLSSLERHTDGTITYSETPATTQVFSRGYSTETVRVIVYSDSPRVWCEEVSPTDYFVFAQQQPTHAE